MKQVVDQYQKSVFRFPLANASSVLAFLFAVLLIEYPAKWESIPLAKCFLVSVLAIPAFVAAQLLEEAHGLRSSKKFLFKVLAAGLLLFYFLWWDGNEVVLVQWLQAGLFFVCFHILISAGPYFNRKQTQYFWQYNRQLLISANVAMFYAFVLCVGTLALIQALIHLFDIAIPWRMSSYTILLFLFVFQTGFLTATLPQSFDAPVQVPRFLRLFVQFVLVPLMAVYFLVIAAYTIRLFWINQPLSLWFAYLILAYIVLALASFALGWPLQDLPEMRWLRKYFRAVFISLIPSGLLLGWFMWGRIEKEGFNFERGFCLTLVFWLLPLTLYFLLSKTKNLKALPISLGIWCFGISIGPWSLFNIDRKEELEKLGNLLSHHALLKDEKWQAGPVRVDEEALYKLESQISYIRQNFGRQALKTVLSQSVLDQLKETKDAKFEQSLFSIMGISFSDSSSKQVSEESGVLGPFMFTFKGNSLEDGIEIEGKKRIYWFAADGDQADEMFLRDSDIGRINESNQLEIEIDGERFTVGKELLVGELKNPALHKNYKIAEYDGADSLTGTYAAEPRNLLVRGSRNSTILLKLDYLCFSIDEPGGKIYLQTVNGYVLK